MTGDLELADLVRRAQGGDRAAWETLVARFEGLVWATARAHRLSPAAAADVAQTTWLRLVENLDRIEDPARLPGWLATTARRESLRHIRLHAREVQVDNDDVFEGPDSGGPEERLVAQERRGALSRAFAQLEERCRGLLRMLAATPPPSYAEVSAALDMPVGAIGPTRARCLEKLRRSPELAGEVA